MFVMWLPVWGTGKKCRASSLRRWRFFGVFFILWFGKGAKAEPRSKQKTIVQLSHG